MRGEKAALFRQKAIFRNCGMQATESSGLASTVPGRKLRGGVPPARRGAGRECGIEKRHFVVRQAHVQCSENVVEMAARFAAGKRYERCVELRSPRKHPCDGEARQ